MMLTCYLNYKKKEKRISKNFKRRWIKSETDITGSNCAHQIVYKGRLITQPTHSHYFFRRYFWNKKKEIIVMNDNN